ncbi:unnamed protein product [Spirodela intermedia]|uniref:DUF8204 domain-containing protein n=1 Tax=Spirodela intermedia TaxID=51605 RepID=A0A7I8JU22_SPIIN|nr:unnamed protein product [Spirodela intermedia]CAA6673676.1 unnamed protein product [Spirodela intermedia]
MIPQKPPFPGYMVGESELEASKEGRNLSDFKYSCVGYSVFMETRMMRLRKERSRQSCHSLLVDRRVSAPSHAAAHAPAIEMVRSPVAGAHKWSGKRRISPGIMPVDLGTEETNCTKFTRNAGLVASGVSRNLHRAANYVKDNLDDILYPDRRRPK